ncbi:MAG: DUF3105 domain-containing protein [Candidatus Rokuibacteriota bacterium]
MAKSDQGRRMSRRARRQWQAVTLVMVALVAVVVGYFAYRAAANLPGTSMPDQGNRHIPRATDPHEPYNSDPPTSGSHLPYLAPWGVHTRPIERELQVHNLEDGGVLVQYNCECPELVDQLRAIVSTYEKFVVLAPYPTMTHRIALTAWTRIDTLDEFDEGRIRRFIDRYRGIDHHK